MMTLLLHENGLRYENLYIYSKTLNQPKYEYLTEVMKPIKEIGFFTFSNFDQIIELDKVRDNSVVVFDDIMVERNQDAVKKYFTQGRHK
ncbi:hypothetical protein SGI37_20390, partial [Providencia rettgeri]